MEDQELLRRYAEDASEDAFRQLVERHAGLVYSVALRQLGRPHQAEEVAHAVFTALAKKAAGLSSSTVLAGWLFRATRFAAAKLQRDEGRRQRREQEAAMMMNSQVDPEPEKDWEQIVPMLDAELETLNNTDRAAVLLRFYEGRCFKEVGAALGTSEDAAKMRVSRAVEKLRGRFVKRGVALSVTALTGALGSKAAAATTIAPPQVAAAVMKACLLKSISNSLVEATARKLIWWRWKPVVIWTSAAFILVVAGVTGWRVVNAPVSFPQNVPAWPAAR